MDEWHLWNKFFHPSVLCYPIFFSFFLPRVTSWASQFLGPWQDQIWKYTCHPSQRDDCYLAQLLCNTNKNLEVRGILRSGLHFHLTFLHESEKPEDGTKCSPFLYERKWQSIILQWHTTLLVDEPGSNRAVAALRLSSQFCHLGCMGSSFPVPCWQSISNSDDWNTTFFTFLFASLFMTGKTGFFWSWLTGVFCVFNTF